MLLDRIAVLLRHLRVERAMVLTLFITVLVTTFLLAAVPRLYNQVLDDELRTRIDSAPASQRNIEVSVEHRFEMPDSADIMARMDQSGADYQAGLAPELQSIIQERRYVIHAPEFSVLKNATAPEPAIARSLRLRYYSGIDEHIEYVAGTPPAARRSVEVSGMSEWLPGHDTVNLDVTEIALSEETAATFGLEPGSVAVIRLDHTGAISAVHVSGIFRLLDRDAPYWNGDPTLARPEHVGYGTDFDELLIGAGLIPLDAHGQMLSLTYPDLFQYTWTYYVDAGSISSSNYPPIVAETRKLLATQGPYSTLANITPDHFEVRNDLGGILDQFMASSQFALAVITLVTIGVLATALASIAVLAALIADRRRATITLLRGRGASSSDLLLAQLVEGTIVCAPAALLGWLAAVIVIDARASLWSLWATLASAGLTIVLLLVAARGNILTHLGRLLGQGESAINRTGRRRITAEALVVVLAVAGIVLLRRRGLAPSADAGFDPVLAAVPVLLALAVGVAGLRLYPYLLAAMARLARRGRGTVLFVGLRGVSGRSTAAHLPLLVMVLAVGIACFAAIVYRTLDNAQVDASWLEVGADYRIESQQVDAIDLSAVDGVTGTAAARSLPIRGGTLIAIDTQGYAGITANRPGDLHLPPALLAGEHSGSESDPIPAIVSTTYLDSDDPQSMLGETVRIALEDQDGFIDVFLRVEQIRDEFRPFPDAASFIVAPLAAIQSAAPDAGIYPTTLFAGGAEADKDAIQTVASQQAFEAARPGRASRSVDVLSLAETHSALSDAPLVRGVSISLLLGSLVAGLYSMLAIVTALILSARSRKREVGYLRTLGLSSRQTAGLTVVEYLPLIVVASLAGLAFGIGVARLVEPGIALGSFIGPGYVVALRIIWWEIGLVPAGLVLVAALAIATFALLAGRTQLGELTRIGDA